MARKSVGLYFGGTAISRVSPASSRRCSAQTYSQAARLRSPAGKQIEYASQLGIGADRVCERRHRQHSGTVVVGPQFCGFEPVEHPVAKCLGLHGFPGLGCPPTLASRPLDEVQNGVALESRGRFLACGDLAGEHDLHRPLAKTRPSAHDAQLGIGANETGERSRHCPSGGSRAGDDLA